MIAFFKAIFRSLIKTFLGLEADKKLIELWERFVHISKKEDALRKGRGQGDGL